jgi:hypothetical protein
LVPGHGDGNAAATPPTRDFRYPSHRPNWACHRPCHSRLPRLGRDRAPDRRREEPAAGPL